MFVKFTPNKKNAVKNLPKHATKLGQFDVEPNYGIFPDLVRHT